MTEIEAEDFYRENHDNTGGLALGEEPPALERTLAAGRTLAQHLIEQLGPSIETELERTIGLQIIGNLDDRGYLDGSVEEIAGRVGGDGRGKSSRCASESFVSTRRASAAWISPSACWFNSRVPGRAEGPLGTIVREHLDLVIGERFRDLARAMGAEIGLVMRWLRRIGELDFRPGRQFSPGPEQVGGCRTPGPMCSTESGESR